MGRSKLLEVSGCNKSFPGVQALADFNFDLYEGEIHCVVGENGAGKSTFIKILSGALRPDEGTISLRGDEFPYLTPKLAQQKGVRTIYQEIALAPSMTVAENIFMGKEPRNRFGLVDYPTLNRQSKTLLDNLQIDLDVRELVSKLNVAEKQSVQIAKAMTDEAKIFILDEPTASYSSSEISNLLELVRGVAARGVGVIYISHHLDEVFNIHDRITILRDGKKVNTHGQNEATEERIISEMVGRDMSKFYTRQKVDVDYSHSIEFNHISGGQVQDVSFTIYKGEIVGFAGMVGSGRTDLVRSIFGANPNSSGKINIEDEEITVSSPAEAIKGGLSLLTEDRQHSGLVLDHTVKWNISLVELVNSRGGLIHEKDEDTNVKHYVNTLDIKTPGLDQVARNLSGGNQQKLVLAKWLYADAKVIIFDEPTRGIDIGAKEEIYKLMVELAKEGKYILMVSSDMPELIAMCDRVFVMRNGEITAELDHDEISEEEILTYSIGGVL